MNQKQFIAVYLLAAAMILGLIMMMTSLWIPLKAIIAQELLEQSWEECEKTGQIKKPWPWADHYAIAKLEAPSLGKEQIILAGDSGRTLAFAPGLNEKAIYQKDAALVISAHRDTHFRFLKDVAIGDPLTLKTHQQKRQFEIVDAVVVDATQTRIQPEAFPEGLILVTCFPFDAMTAGGPLRYVVFAKEIKPQPKLYAM